MSAQPSAVETGRALPGLLRALIEEARRRARRRRALIALAALGAAAFALGVALAVGRGGDVRPSTPGSGASAGAERAAIAAAAARTPVVEAGVAGGSATVGWAVNGLALFLTTDGGTHWRTITPPALRRAGDPVARIVDLDVVDSRTIWISAADVPGTVQANGSLRHSELERSDDGGRRWRSVVLPGCLACSGASLSFVDHADGFALVPFSSGGVPSPRLYRTGDGGATWQVVSAPPAGGRLLFTSRSRGWLVTDPSRWAGPTHSRPLGGGVLYRTTDGGRSWRRARLPVPARYRGHAATVGVPRFFGLRDGVVPVRFRDAKTRAQQLVVYSTHDGGLRWTTSLGPSQADLRTSQWGIPQASGFSAATPRDWALFANGVVYLTHDAGARWIAVRPRYAPRVPGVWDFSLTSPTSAWAIFAAGRAGAALVRTENSGRDWRPLRLR